MKNITLFIALVLSAYFVSAQPYLPLSAGSSYPLTGDFYVNARINASSSGTSFTNNFALSGTGANTFNIYPFIDGNTYLQHDGNVIFSPVASTIPQLVINSSGNVGIGTINPGQKLDVSGVGRFISGSSSLPALTTAGAGAIGNINQGALQFGDANSSYMVQGGADYLGLNFISNAITAVHVDVNGKVGIGTTTPNYKLDIYKGAIGSALNITGSAVGTRNDVGMDFSAVNAVIATYARIGLQISNGGTGVETGGLVFSTVNAGSLTEKMFINAAGYVGIGTTTPDQLLSVNGNIHAQEVLVNLTGFEDRVFNKNYRLPTLTEVKDYVEKNHHLPDVPSEAEVVNKGINLGDMDRTLTKKIEELTLYLIQQQKQLTEQQKINNSLLKRINKLESKSSLKRLAK